MSTLTIIPPQYDMMDDDGGRTRNSFDPAFTADITVKMNVPHRLGAVGHYDDFRRLHNDDQQDSYRLPTIADMAVPDKIVLLGQGESLGVKEEVNLHLNDFPSLPSDNYSYVNVTTPPRVLTLEECPFPTVEDSFVPAKSALTSDVASEYRALRDGLPYSLDVTTTQDGAPADSSLAYIGNGVDSELVLLQRHLARLARHVSRLEAANASRLKREMILYPVVVGYLLYSIAKWFVGNNK